MNSYRYAAVFGLTVAASATLVTGATAQQNATSAQPAGRGRHLTLQADRGLCSFPQWGRYVGAYSTDDGYVVVNVAYGRPGDKVEGYAPNGFPYNNAAAVVQPGETTAESPKFPNTRGLDISFTADNGAKVNFQCQRHGR